MTWIDEAAALGTSGVVAAILYWLGRRVAGHLEALLKQILAILTTLQSKLEDIAHLEELTRPHPPTLGPSLHPPSPIAPVAKPPAK